ncbi:MAG: hypothetical protein AAGI90_03980 [Chlamydiota bacterium]
MNHLSIFAHGANDKHKKDDVSDMTLPETGTSPSNVADHVHEILSQTALSTQVIVEITKTAHAMIQKEYFSKSGSKITLGKKPSKKSAGGALGSSDSAEDQDGDVPVNAPKKSQSPFNLFSNLSELQGLETQMKTSQSAVESAAISASSPQSGKATKGGKTQPQQNSLGSSNGAPDFPTNDPNYPPPPFDPNDVPTSQNDITQRFNDWLRAIRSSSNPNTLFAFLQWMVNLQNQMGNTPFVQSLFNQLATVTSDDGTSFAEMVVSALRASWYYSGNYNVSDEMSELAQMFQGMSGDNDLFNQISFYANNESQDIDSWIQDQKDNPVPDFFSYQMGQLYDWFHDNKDLKAQLHKWFMDQVNDLVRRFKNNPELLITLIFTVFGGSMNNMQYQLGDYGTLNDRLEDISKKLSDIQNKFADISNGQTPDPNEAADLESMTKEMQSLQYEVQQLQHMFGPSIVSSTNNALDKIFGANVGPNGETLRDLSKQQNPDWNGAAKYIKDNGIFYKAGSTTPGEETPGGPTDLTNAIQEDLRTASSTYTSQSQTISVQMKTITQQIQSFEGEIKSMVITDYSQGWLKQLVQNQIQP